MRLGRELAHRRTELVQIVLRVAEENVMSRCGSHGMAGAHLVAPRRAHRVPYALGECVYLFGANCEEGACGVSSVSVTVVQRAHVLNDGLSFRPT